MSLEATGIGHSPSSTLPPPVEETEEYFSFVEAFASGGYTFGSQSDTSDKVRVIGMWILSFVFPIFPLITFFVCWVKDLSDLFTVPDRPEFQIAPPSNEEAEAMAHSGEEMLGSDDEEDSIEEAPPSNQKPILSREQSKELLHTHEVAASSIIPTTSSKEDDTTSRSSDFMPIQPEFPLFATANQTTSLHVEGEKDSPFVMVSPTNISNEAAIIDAPPHMEQGKVTSSPEVHFQERIPQVKPSFTPPPHRETIAIPPKPVDNRPRLKPCHNILSGVGENYQQAVHTMIRTMATGDGSSIQALKEKPIITYLDGILPTQTLAIILSNRESIQHLATLKTRKNVWIFISVNPYKEFCGGWAGMDVKRKAMGEPKWQAEIAKFEAYCNVEPGTYARLTTQEFIDTIIANRNALHEVVQRRIAQAAK